MLTAYIICCILTLAYVALMLLYRHGWQQQSYFDQSRAKPSTRVSIIIPARNEAANIGTCLKAIIAQDYPKELYEVIVVDDHSEDDTVAIVNSFTPHTVKCIKLADHIDSSEAVNAYKKKALAAGIGQGTGDLIVTTDADCIAKPQWLSIVVAFHEEHKPVMIAAPVDFSCDGSVLQLFQSIDFMSMQGITAAAQKLQLGNMANGANLAFSREAYESVDGYKGIEHLASGDDYLLMVKLQNAYPGRIWYLKNKEAIVATAPQLTWAGFLQQRIRWASKTGKYNDGKLTAILAFVYLFNLSFLALLIAGFLNPLFFGMAALMLCWKIISELSFLFPVAGFFNKKKQLLYFPLLQPLHIAYIILAGFLGFVGVYKWKGRSVR